MAYLRDADRDKIVFDCLTLGIPAKDEAEALGFSVNAVRWTVRVFQLVKAGNWDRIREEYTGHSSRSIAALEWAMARMNAEAPSGLMTVIEAAQKENKSRYEKPEQGPNEAELALKVLKALETLIAGQELILDALMKKEGE